MSADHSKKHINYKFLTKKKKNSPFYLQNNFITECGGDRFIQPHYLLMWDYLGS